MKLYLASNFDLKDKVIFIHDMLIKNGFEITVKWWEKDFKKIGENNSDKEWYSLQMIQQISYRNFKGIYDADVLILIAPDNEATKFNGANIEVGYAIGKGKPVFSIGKIERSAMYQPVKQFDNIEYLINELKIIGE